MEEIKVVKGWNLISFKNDGILDSHNIVTNSLFTTDSDGYTLVENLKVFATKGYWIRCNEDGIIKNNYIKEVDLELLKLKNDNEKLEYDLKLEKSKNENLKADNKNMKLNNNKLVSDLLPIKDLEPAYIEEFKSPLGLLRNLTLHNSDKSWRIKNDLLTFDGFKLNDPKWEKTESWLFFPIQRNNVPEATEVHCDVWIKGDNITSKSSLEVWYSYNHKKLEKPDLDNWNFLFNLEGKYKEGKYTFLACDIPEIPTTYDDPAELIIGFRYISESSDQVGSWTFNKIDSHFH